MTRKEAVERAMASMEMEGFVYTEKEKEIFKQIANEELDVSYIYKYAKEQVSPYFNNGSPND